MIKFEYLVCIVVLLLFIYFVMNKEQIYSYLGKSTELEETPSKSKYSNKSESKCVASEQLLSQRDDLIE